MTIDKQADGGKLVVKVSGRLDTMTAPQLEKELKDSIPGVSQLVLDFADLDYISSAGLRVVLGAQKAMTAQNGTMVVRNLNEAVRDVFDITGFTSILTVE